MKLAIYTVLLLSAFTACAQRPAAPLADGNPSHFDLSSFPKATDKVTKSDAEWRALVPADAYDVLRDEGTERPFTGSLLKNHQTGIFTCAACGNPLFASDTKFESGTGWPSFWAPIEKGRVIEKPDNSIGMSRTEVVCGRCGSHLGHVFDDGPQPTGLRYCMNSVALGFVKE